MIRKQGWLKSVFREGTGWKGVCWTAGRRGRLREPAVRKEPWEVTVGLREDAVSNVGLHLCSAQYRCSLKTRPPTSDVDLMSVDGRPGIRGEA